MSVAASLALTGLGFLAGALMAVGALLLLGYSIARWVTK